MARVGAPLHARTWQEREALAAVGAAEDLARLSWTEGRDEPTPLALRRDAVLTFGGVAVVPPPGGFVQPTAEGEAMLVELVMNAVPAGAETAADLFAGCGTFTFRSEEHTSELQSLMRISYAVFCLKKKKNI